MTGLEMKYFILKPRGGRDDPYAVASRAAMKAYAKAIEAENSSLCHDLEMWRIEEQGKADRDDLQRRLDAGEIDFPESS